MLHVLTHFFPKRAEDFLTTGTAGVAALQATESATTLATLTLGVALVVLTAIWIIALLKPLMTSNKNPLPLRRNWVTLPLRYATSTVHCIYTSILRMQMRLITWFFLAPFYAIELPCRVITYLVSIPRRILELHLRKLSMQLALPVA